MNKRSYAKVLMMDAQLFTGICVNTIWVWMGSSDHELGPQWWFEYVCFSQFNRNFELASAFSSIQFHLKASSSWPSARPNGYCVCHIFQEVLIWGLCRGDPNVFLWTPQFSVPKPGLLTPEYPMVLLLSLYHFLLNIHGSSSKNGLLVDS